MLGKPHPAIDSLIAATDPVHDLSVVTRNTQIMEGSKDEVINSWTYEPITWCFLLNLYAKHGPAANYMFTNQVSG